MWVLILNRIEREVQLLLNKDIIELREEPHAYERKAF